MSLRVLLDELRAKSVDGIAPLAASEPVLRTRFYSWYGLRWTEACKRAGVRSRHSLPKFDWDEAKRRYQAGASIEALAVLFAVSQQSVRNAVIPGERQLRYQRWLELGNREKRRD